MTHIEEWMRTRYDENARGYRQDDELDATGEDHQQIAARLAEICESFQRPIAALDIGCGTGRFFHALKNVCKLVGIDVSEEMLALARHPVREEEVTVDCIELRRGNFYDGQLADGSFDFIYAIGVFGNGCPVTAEVLRKIFRWLRPEGRLFFDVLDSENLSGVQRLRKWIRGSVYLALPARVQREWDRITGWPPMFMTTKGALARSVRRAGFSQVEVERRFMRLPLGDAWKLQCLARKSDRVGVNFV